MGCRNRVATGAARSAGVDAPSHAPTPVVGSARTTFVAAGYPRRAVGGPPRGRVRRAELCSKAVSGDRRRRRCRLRQVHPRAGDGRSEVPRNLARISPATTGGGGVIAAGGIYGRRQPVGCRHVRCAVRSGSQRTGQKIGQQPRSRNLGAHTPSGRLRGLRFPRVRAGREHLVAPSPRRGIPSGQVLARQQSNVEGLHGRP